MNPNIPALLATPPLAVVAFDKDGIGTGLYTEALDLRTLGRLQITRASQVEFNDLTQQWEVFDYTGRLVFTHSSRQQCLDWERNFFNQTPTP